ncbi:MAG: hypothetical protein LJE67_10515 [Salaquimonas sp.]|jgi:hypothetical protein|nr:hypothetical protein [Salaquimonas sp.]
MLNRTKRSTIHLSSAFSLVGIEQMLPAGNYTIVEDEGLIEDLSWAAYRRAGTFIEVPAALSSASAIQMFEIDRAELDAAISRGIASLATGQAESSDAPSGTP